MPLPPIQVLYTIDALWLIFALYWLINAFNNKKAVYKQPLHQRLFYLLPAPLLYFLVLACPSLLIPFFHPTLPLQLLGILLTLLGIAFAVYARTVLGRNWSGWVSLKQDHTLIQHGPYRLTRHPIYTGLLTAVLGTVLALTPSLIGLLTIIIIGGLFALKIKTEEKLMHQQFPDDYLAYQKKVKTTFIPFIY